MKTETVFLLLNGETPKKMPDMLSYNFICATDGAYQFLKKHNITPNLISGDFDSLKKIPNEIEAVNTPNQNFTDFDKILSILHKKGLKKIHIYGASGKEEDHFLGNLHTALKWKEKLDLTFYDNYFSYFFASNYLKINNCENKIISLFPFHEAKNISTKGLKFSLKKESLSFGNKIGTRNCAIENEVEISFEKGNLIVFVQL